MARSCSVCGTIGRRGGAGLCRGAVFSAVSPLDAAFARLSREELGLTVTRGDAHLLGAYDHLYEEDVFGAGIGTHYVALGHYLRLEVDVASLPTAQHQDYRWWHPDAMRASSEVHANTRVYLDAVAARRQ